MRNSLYSVTIEEALLQIEGTNSYQKRLLVLVMVLWLLWLSIYRYFELQFSEEDLTTYKLGMLIGSPCILLLSNYIGRKLSSIIASALTGVLLALLIILQEIQDSILFAIGGLTAGSMITSFLIMIEVVQSQYRSSYTILLFSSFGISISIGTVLQMLANRTIVLGTTALLAVFVSVLFTFSKESPRHLAAVKGKYALTRKILNIISITNRASGFADILEGEKVIGNAELQTENTPSPSKSEGKHSFVQISEAVVSVTSAELSAVKKYNLLNIWLYSQTRKNLLVLLFAGVLVSSSKSISHSTEAGFSNTESICLGLLTGGLLIPVNILLNKTSRHFSLLILLGFSTITSIVALVFESKKCDSQRVCNLIEITSFSLISISSISLLGCLIIVYLISVETLQTTIRSLGMFYMELALKSGIMVGALFTSETIIFQLILGVSMMSMLCFFSLCFLDDKTDVTMEDYLNEDREEMNKPVEISHMNISIPIEDPRI